MESQLQNLRTEALQKIANTKSEAELLEVEKSYLGKTGSLQEVLKSVKDLSADQKPVIGKLSNEIKKEIELEVEKQKRTLKAQAISHKLQSEFLDVTLPGQKPPQGHLHLIPQTQKEVEKIFGELGFAVMDGPEVESEYYNFEALNIPDTHPARDMQDTFFLNNKQDQEHGRMVLRTHTSPVQIRSMLQHGAPLRIIAPGRVFRYEATDASHDSTFHQVEGLLIDENISLSHLKGVMAEFLTRLFGQKVKVRFRPGYFPFVEPGLELDFSCLLCNGAGCRVCKQSGWVEFMGAGMVHPNVLKAGGIDTDKYQGWAFGFGLTRLVMMKHRITDIRYLMNGDLRFINQF
jgi:phenylalanyl-tRNA synthetase alpha chain